MAATAKNSAIIYGSSQMLSNTLWISTPMRPHSMPAQSGDQRVFAVRTQARRPLPTRPSSIMPKAVTPTMPFSVRILT